MEKRLPGITGLGDACCGCGACAAKCPHGCISMGRDKCGFLHPPVNANICVGCGACDSACPVIGKREEDDCEAVYWAKSKNEPEKLASSSGGIFALLAHEVLNAGGVVCGAAWESDFKGVRHVLIEDEADLDSVMRSKYVQSTVGVEVYEGIRAALKANRRVLFTGTACQVSGMRGYLGKLADSEFLLLVDVICHGVPAPLLWEKWAVWREARAGAPLRGVNMRSKTTGWLSFSAAYSYAAEKDGRAVADGSAFGDDWYFKAFLSNASLRPSCFNCPAKRACGSDITLGDFWGVQSTHPDVDYEGGVSAVLCNTAKGVAALETLGANLERGESSLEKVLPGNPSLVRSVRPYARRDEFMRDLGDGMGIDGLMAKYDFKPTLVQRARGKLGGAKRRLKKLLGR
ncbi:Coenzyme F420 hydrogenase/dehydrogenase, beta subunit C-terminal domain [Paratractidigestivibacter sp.]|uniref:Coenzyme F420 hydrogenase/dehydrogenase, beta subunit C-terminal domain n=1 Tax=Paratractidigestivibacter sp. TaxID=2847316 RepID=UPI002AC9AE6E|nr:Coenzyme F420 hydrogenase/dehydrogenase, beta subunit C-terminal domain [Paratractidigestivibacter sp.]